MADGREGSCGKGDRSGEGGTGEGEGGGGTGEAHAGVIHVCVWLWEECC